MSYGYIYLIKDHFTNKVYIGQKKGFVEGTEWYFGSGIIIKQIIKKRKHHLSKTIIGCCDTKEELNQAEIDCIEFYNSTNFLYGYNLSFGGEGHKLHHTKETKNKISKKCKAWNLIHDNSFKGRKHSELTKRHLSKKHTGKKLSAEHKLKIGLVTKGKSYEELYGVERAIKLREQRSESNRRRARKNHENNRT